MVWFPLGDNPQPPPRRGVGTEGRRIQLQSNHFPVRIQNKNLEVIHYDVDITNPGLKYQRRIPKAWRLLIFEDMKAQYPKVFKNFALAFDSEKNAYCVSNIPQLKKGFKYEVNFKNPDTGYTDKYAVTLTVVNHASLKELLEAVKGTSPRAPAAATPVVQTHTIFQMLEVMFQHTPAIRFERVGRNTFYSCEGEFGPNSSLGGGKEAVVGFFSSLRRAQWKDGSLLLNVDISHTAFYKEQSVLDHLKETLKFQGRDFNSTLDPGKQKRLLKELKGLKVQSTHTAYPRTYKVCGVTPTGANRTTFPLTDPSTNTTSNCTVEKYFMMQYNKRLEHPNLNCLKVGPMNKNIYLPIECCRIAGRQKVQKKLGEDETAKLIRSTARPPLERLRSISNIRQIGDFNNDPMVKSLQFSIADEPLNLLGRVLQPPKLRMNEDLEPRRGSWDARDKKFFDGAELNSWVVMNYEPKFIDQHKMMKFLEMLKRMGIEKGMAFSDPVIRASRNPNPEREFREIKERMPTVQMILVVLPNYGDIYSRVKKTGDREVSVVTQCVKSTNVQSCKPPTVGNILLKINAKMGGTNNVLSQVSQPVVFCKPVMIMGADVNHPPAGDEATPSLAAVVASTDRYASKYACEVRHQMHRTEVIQDMKEITKNLLIAFYRLTKHKPERIVMYRDGVSESQFAEVLSFELRKMREACSSLEKGYEPAITFLVVQKRHHTRLFCQERDGVGKSKNIPPGTTVDTTITHPTEGDFYLCSHEGIQGTSKPSHYHILWDDSEMNMDHLQKLTFALCHLYSRCTRSVSIPAPAYYAHLAAFRAKVHIHDICSSDSASSASGGGTAEPVQDAVMSQACRIGLEHAKEIFSKLYYI